MKRGINIARSNSTLSFAFASALVSTVAFARPPVYRVLEIPTLGGPLNRAAQVSDAGHVVGWSETGQRDDEGRLLHRAFLWYDGAATNLGTLGGLESEATAVNSAGQVVGWAHVASGKRHAFLWLPEPAYRLPAGMNDLGTLNGTQSQATDINERGEVVGTTDNAIFLWLPQPAWGLQAGMFELCRDAACPETLSTAINDLTQVMATDQIWLPAPHYGLPAGSSAAQPPGQVVGYIAIDLNNSGAVSTSLTGFTSFLQVFDLWTGVFFRASAPDNTPSAGFGINERSDVVGSFVGVGRRRAVHVSRLGRGDLWTFTYLDERVDMRGWQLTDAWDINNADWVVAEGRRSSGTTRVLLLRPLRTNLDGLQGTDLRDYRLFAPCMTEPAPTAAASCPNRDVNQDGAVDIADYQAIQIGFTGSE